MASARIRSLSLSILDWTSLSMSTSLKRADTSSIEGPSNGYSRCIQALFLLLVALVVLVGGTEAGDRIPVVPPPEAIGWRHCPAEELVSIGGGGGGGPATSDAADAAVISEPR